MRTRHINLHGAVEGFKLPTKAKRKWVQALRSGGYEQGYGDLRCNGGGYCCLGVYASVCGVEDADLDGVALLSSLTASAIELLDAPLPGDIEDHLAFLNDNEALSFDEIADWIEENL